MARSQWRSRRKVSGGLYHYFRGKKQYELAGIPAQSKIEIKATARKVRTLGGHFKQKILSTNLINVSDKSGKTARTEMLKVVENPADANLVRRNIFNRGAIVETKLGRTKITSRPGQHGTVQGVLLE